MSDSGAPQIFSTLGAFLYGNASVDAWVARGDDAAAVGEPWTGFDRARALWHAGQVDEAAEIWWQIAHAAGLESRAVLQAWHFLRLAGRAVPDDEAKAVLGVVVSMPVAGAHDVLAAYADGSARYLNQSGKAAVVEDRDDPAIQEPIARWLEVGASIARVIGPADDADLPPLGSDDARVLMLTPGGPCYGQGPADALTADPMAGAFIRAATAVLQPIVARATA